MRIFICLTILSIFINAQNIENDFNKLNVEDFAKIISKITGKALPKRLDNITIAKSTYYEKNIYGIKKYIVPLNEKVRENFKPYLVSKLYEKQSFYDQMKSNEVQNICKSKLLRLFLNKNGIVKIDYYNEEEESILFILLKKEDCK